MDPILTLISAIEGIPYLGPVAVYIPAVITIGAVISMFLPAPPAGANWAWKVAYEIVQWCALNKGHGVNLNSPAVSGIVAGPAATVAPQIATASVPKPTA